MEKKKSSNNVRILIVVLVAIIVFGLAVGANSLLSSQSNSPFKNARVQDIPRIITTVFDAKGESHKLTADVTLIFDKKLEAVDDKTLQSSISEVISQLEYDKVNSTDGIEYAKEKIKEKLGESYTEEQLQGIYISEFASDVSLPATNRTNSNQKALKGLFRNIE